jgi:iron complex transport system substrate-binding protein
MPLRRVGVLPTALTLAGLLGLLTYGGSARVALLGYGPLRATRIEGDHFPKRLIDPAGTVQTIPAPPQRIASAILSGDHMLTALVSPDRLAGVTYLVDDPTISNIIGVVPPSVPRITAEIETLLALQPDLVLVAGYTRAETVRLLVAANIPVVRFHRYASFQEVMDNLRTLGAAVGAVPQAERLIDDMRHRIDAVMQRVGTSQRPRVLYHAPAGYTMGAETLIDEMIQLAGGFNVARETQLTGPVKLPQEVMLSLAPDVIIVGDWSATPGAEAVRELMHNPVWQHVPAVANGRVHAIRGAWLTSVSQDAVHGLEAMARLLHPEAFAL